MNHDLTKNDLANILKLMDRVEYRGTNEVKAAAVIIAKLTHALSAPETEDDGKDVPATD